MKMFVQQAQQARGRVIVCFQFQASAVFSGDRHYFFLQSSNRDYVLSFVGHCEFDDSVMETIDSRWPRKSYTGAVSVDVCDHEPTCSKIPAEHGQPGMVYGCNVSYSYLQECKKYFRNITVHPSALPSRQKSN
jgi:hypothetical protein